MTLDKQRWEQIERLYRAALERGPDAREAFLDKACAGGEDLRREVAGLWSEVEKERECLGFNELMVEKINAPEIGQGQEIGVVWN